MLQCHKCGKNVLLGTEGLLNKRTGAHSDGTAFFRTVVYCPRCEDEEKSSQDFRDLNRKRLLIAGAVLAMGLAVCLVLVGLGIISPVW